MAETSKVSYIPAYGNITKVLGKIKTASVPDRFTQDFLSTRLGLSGGSPKAVIPFLKRAGFLNSDGSPTERYRQFRNESQSGLAAAGAMRQAYAALYEMNEYVHALNDKDLRGLIVQATGLEQDSSTTKAMIGSFKALRAFADFDMTDENTKTESDIVRVMRTRPQAGIAIGLTLAAYGLAIRLI